MRDTDDMPNVTQAEFKQLVSQNTGRIAEAKQTMVCKHSMQAHRSRMQQAFVTEVAERGMSVNNLDLFPDEDLPQYWK